MSWIRRHSTSISSGRGTGTDAPTPVTDRRCQELLDAVIREDDEAVLAMVKKNPSLISKDLTSDKRRLLHIVAARQRTSLLKSLFFIPQVDKSTALKKDAAGNTVVHAAVESGNVTTLRELVDHAVQKEIQNIQHLRSAPKSQVKEAEASLARELMSQPNKMKQFPIHLAVISGNEDMVDQLLKYGSKAFSKNWLDQECVDPLKLAAKHNLTSIFWLLWKTVKEQAKATKHQDRAGNTCLHYAARHNNRHVADILLSQSSASEMLRLCNKDDQNPASVALAYNHMEMKAYLENWRPGGHILVPDNPEEQDEATTSRTYPTSSESQSFSSSHTETTANTINSIPDPRQLRFSGLSMTYEPQRTNDTYTSCDPQNQLDPLLPYEAQAPFEPQMTYEPRGTYIPQNTSSSYDGSQLSYIIASDALRTRGTSTEVTDAAVSDLIQCVQPMTMGHTYSEHLHTQLQDDSSKDAQGVPPFTWSQSLGEDRPSSSSVGTEKKDIEEHAAQLQGIQDSIMQSEQRASELRQQLEELRKMEKETEALTAEIEEMQGLDFQSQREVLLSLRAELPELRRQNEYLTLELAALREENVQLRQKQVELQEQLQHEQDSQNEVQQQLAEQRSIVRSLESFISDASEKHALLMQDKTEADTQIRELRQRLDEAMASAHAVTTQAQQEAAYAQRQYEEAMMHTSKVAQFIAANIGGRSLVVWACAISDADLLRFVIKAGCGVNDQNEDSNTGLHVACLNANDECLILLLVAEADPNIQNQDGNTPLHFACMYQQPEMVRVMLQHAANPALQNQAGRTPWQEAIRQADFLALAVFLDWDRTYEVEFLFDGARNGNVLLVQWLMRRGGNPVDGAAAQLVHAVKDNQTALHTACTAQHVELARILLQAGARTQARDGNDDTALHFACNSENIHLARVLVQAGADHSAKNRDGISPLVIAAQLGNHELMMVLLNNAATPLVPPVNNVPPHEFLCPISQELMEDPYQAPDGWVYEKAALQNWLSRNSISPMTRTAITFAECVPNYTLRGAIQRWKDEHPDYSAE